MLDKVILDEIDTFGTVNSFLCTPENCREYLTTSDKSMNIIHLNIRSINCNFDKFRVFLASTKIICDAIVLTECWLNASYTIPEIEGYTSYNTTKLRNQNDGVIVFVKNSIPHTVLEPPMADASCLICNFSHYKLSLVAIYRSPAVYNLDMFFIGLNKVLTSLTSQHNIIIMGDINIDIGVNNLVPQGNDYLNLIASHGLYPSHSLPTRGNSCIDHVMVKSHLKTVTLIFDTYITDHKPTFIKIETTIKTPTNKSARNVIDYIAVVEKISSFDFNFIINIQDANIAAELLISTIGSVIKKHSKIVYISSKQKIIKPWITRGLLRCIRNRDNLSRKLKKEPENYTLKLIYIRYRNFCNKLLKNLKISFERTELQKNKNNPKATWKTIKNITNINYIRNSSSELLNTFTDNITSINNVNNFFANIGQKLSEKFTNNVRFNDKSNLIEPPNSFAVLPTDENEVRRLIVEMRIDAAAGWDGISAKLLKSCIQALAPVITHICNLSISSGCFPKVFKKAVVHPIFKNGDKNNVTNYRPISILPALSKILEKILNNRLINYLESFNLLANNQFGFRRGKSTEEAVSSLTNHVVEKLDGKMKCLGIFLDISKAFDTVSTPHLLRKLEVIGVRGHAHKIFQDYLCDRTQCVKINDIYSDSKPLKFGVPQGSVLGSTMFLIYINSLCNLTLSNCSIFTYADDTALLIHGTDWPDTIKHAEVALNMVLGWLSNNLLTINLNKTVFLPFSLQSIALPPLETIVLKAHNCSLSLSSVSDCSCPQLTGTYSTKYLGITIDSLLNWKPHIEMLTSRVRKLIYIFKRLRVSAEYETLKSVYYALCQSVISYCITAWGGAPKLHLLKLERAQRAVLKVMTFKPFRYPTDELYRDCQVLTVRQLFVLHTILRKHASLQYDANVLSRRRFYSVCPTPRVKTAFAKRHFLVLGSHLYNKANKHCKIFSLCRQLCKIEVSKWLQTKTYDATENLIKLCPL